MSSTTRYDVVLAYSLQDTASQGLRSMAGTAKEAASSTDLLSASLTGLVATAGAYAGLHQMKEAFIGFNDEMQQMRISSAAMMAENGIASSFDAAIPKANELVESF